tara:strand:- start:851 stop:1081 length:231 start_codon:yes stop_codon:yes gene_type:complete
MSNQPDINVIHFDLDERGDVVETSYRAPFITEDVIDQTIDRLEGVAESCARVYERLEALQKRLEMPLEPPTKTEEK